MVLKELLKTDALIWFKALRHIVMSREQIKELISALLRSLWAILNIRVSAWVKFKLDFINFKYTVSIIIKFLESLLD